MKVIVFILVVIVLLALLICLVSLTKYLNFDRKIKEAQIKNNPWYRLDKTLTELEKITKNKKHDKNINKPQLN